MVLIRFRVEYNGQWAEMNASTAPLWFSNDPNLSRLFNEMTEREISQADYAANLNLAATAFHQFQKQSDFKKFKVVIDESNMPPIIPGVEY